MNKKLFISAEQLEKDAWQFALQLYKEKIDFDWIVGVTRGGAQISIYIQEALSLLCHKKIKYSIIQAQSYSAIGKAGGVVLGNIDPLVLQMTDNNKVLVIDDVFDRGRTLAEVKKCLEFRLASFETKLFLGALYYKPENSEVSIFPDFYYQKVKSSDWLVFPHELCGLSLDERKAKGFPL